LKICLTGLKRQITNVEFHTDVVRETASSIAVPENRVSNHHRDELT
jgi:hypothetical protein